MPAVVRVLDPSTAPMAGVVLLVNPGRPLDSLALITDSRGYATLPDLDCKACVITAMDPRRLFFSTTTEFEGEARSVTLVLPVRPVVNILFLPGSIRATVQVNGPDGRPLPGQAVLVRPKVEAMEDNWFYVDTTDHKGRVSIKLRPGEYVLASLVNGKFLEAPLNLALNVKQECSERQVRCLIADAPRAAPKVPLVVSLTAPNDSH